ncbi:tetratricopeptide repeat protein [Tunturibacter psychrotolerans]|uniref:Tetratricopeptide repeat protein n=1 Tax=Tunturiibacter psychrotolerans TaxID=3069686 RepID=A0AAU7ZPU7_9BACT
MPFGKVDVRVDEISKPIRVDFNKIYTELLEPALREAGCDPSRADSQATAGDIRTDMFFDLVTADLVLADLSIPNPNVYYELGIRDGVCARGVFIVQGGWTVNRPFDVASDRSFSYKGDLFLIDDSNSGPNTNNIDVSAEVQRLAEEFRKAFASESQATGSPLYSHLPGLRQVDWENIDTSKSHFFGTLERDWEERVRIAQELQRPGNIITLAQGAPTRIHRAKILSRAARSLIGLCQFAAAEEVLTEILHLAPDDVEAQLQLGVVLNSRGETERAESQMRAILSKHETNPEAGMVLGDVYRMLWYMQWKNGHNVSECRERARDSSRLLVAAIRSYLDVQSRHPDEYLSGYNALLLIAVFKKLFPRIELPHPPIFDREELSVVVRYAARGAGENAEVTGDYDTQFWSAVALSGLELLNDNKDAVLHGIRDACAVPSATLFYLRSFMHRLVLLESLNFKMDIISEAITIVQAKLDSKRQRTTWGKVIVFYGYPIDKLNSLDPRFPSSSVPAVNDKIKEALTTWEVGKGDLAICGTATEGDVMFAEDCLDRGAHVRLLVLEPTPGELAAGFKNPALGEWTTRAYALVEHPGTEVWYHKEELGDAVDPAHLPGRQNRWILNTARMEGGNARGDNGLYGVFLWNGGMDVDNSQDPSFFVAELRRANPYKGGILAINPCALISDKPSS